jgi:hypothetical protein
MIGIIFWDAGYDMTHTGITYRISLCFGPAAFFVFLTIAALPFFMIERGIFEKEKNNNLYGIMTFVLSRTVASVPGLIVVGFSTCLAVVYMPAIDNYIEYAVIMTILLMIGEQVAMLISVIFPHFIIGMIFLGGAHAVSMQIEGFFKVNSKLPEYLQWASWGVINKYAFRGMMLTQFEHVDEIEESFYRDGNHVLEFHDIKDTTVEIEIA